MKYVKNICMTSSGISWKKSCFALTILLIHGDACALLRHVGNVDNVGKARPNNMPGFCQNC